MKLSKNLTLVMMLIFSALIFAQCSDDANPAAPVATESQSNSADFAASIEDYPMEDVSESEAEGLAFMREEEKLARDVYITLYEQWGMRVFTNISRSEQMHTDAVAALLERYNLQDPVATDSIGVFTNTDLKALYDQLIEMGNASLIDALKVGAAIEEIDILDLQKQLDDVVDNQDIAYIYENLMRGSRNHLRAFTRNLENQGVDYAPQYLDQETYDAIVNSPMERGNH